MCPQADVFKKQGKLEQAIGECEQCLKASTSKSKQQQIQKDIDSLKAEIVSKSLEEAASVFKGEQTIANYEKAIRILNAQKQYDQGSGISARLADYRRQIENLREQINKFLETAKLETAKAQWRDAVQSVGQALKLDPDDSSIASRFAGLIEERNEYYKLRIKSECDKRDYVEASKVLKSFGQEQPAPSDLVLKSIESLVNETKGQAVRSEVEKLIADKKYFTAYSRIQETEVKNCKDLLEDVRLKGSEFYKNLAYKEKTNVNNFHAYIAAVKAKILSPDNNEIFILHRDMTDIVDDSIWVKIGIAEFKAPTAELGAGREFTGMLVSHLGKLLPYGVRIDEPEKIKFSENRGAQEGEVIVQLGQKLGIFGDVSTLEVNTRREESENTIIVPLGEEESPNPQYQQMMMLYGRDTSKWPSIPPATLKKSTTTLAKYKRGKQLMEGRMVVSVRLYSAASNASIGNETLSAQLDCSDTFQEGVQGTDIKEDPLEMPKTELQMKQELKQNMVEKTSKWILERDLALNLGFFQLRQKHYYKQAEDIIGRREYNEAVKVLAQGYLYCLRDNIPENDEWFQKIRQKVLYELTE